MDRGRAIFRPRQAPERPYRAVALIGAPFESEARAQGVNLAPGALRAAGLVNALETAHLGVEELGDLDIAITDPEPDPVSGVIALEQLAAASRELRDTIVGQLDEHRPILVLGGCCGVLPGIAAALQLVHGRVGLAFVDGHYDTYDAATSPTGGALADMELRVLTGDGPDALTRLGARHPLVEARDVWVLGARDRWEMVAAGAPDPHVDLADAHHVDDAGVRRHGPGRVGAYAARALAGDPGHFWLHLDLDVLSNHVFPGVDSPLPGGLTWDELGRLLVPLAATPGFLGADVTIYDPTLDPERVSARRIVALLTEVLAGVRR
ncbi:MAG: arginase family protein [Thermoleophilia bacterium]|jgi:arginase|nr:arginase family protein [Thermoleophilia bacterium]